MVYWNKTQKTNTDQEMYMYKLDRHRVTVYFESEWFIIGPRLTTPTLIKKSCTNLAGREKLCTLRENGLLLVQDSIDKH